MWMLQRGHSGDGCVLASTLCKYDLRKGDLFVLSWARVRRMRRGSLSSELLMCGGGVRSILLLSLVARCLETINVCMTYPSSPQSKYRLQQNRQTFTNYKKADWTQFLEDTLSVFAQTTIPTNIHTANRIFTNIILMAGKHNIPKDKMHSNCRLLPKDIVCKITQRNNIRRANTCDPALKLLHAEITSDIQKYKQNIWKEHLDAHWDHRHNTHILWKTIHGISLGRKFVAFGAQPIRP